MKKILTFALALACASSFAQQRFAIKIYQNTDLYTTTVDEWWKSEIKEIKNFNFNRLSIALTFNKKRVAHEVEFFLPEFSKSPDDLQFPMNYEYRKDPRWVSEANAYAFRYEVSKVLSRKSSPLQISLGAAINPYYVSIINTPVNNTIYPNTLKWSGASINLIPRITYTITEHLFFDINIPLKAMDLRWKYQRIENPSIPIRNQESGDIEALFFESAYTVRFGLGYSFGKNMQK